MGNAGCRPSCVDHGCQSAVHRRREGWLEDEWALNCSPETLFQLELKQRCQWARAAGVPTPAASSGASPSGCVDPEALFHRDLKEVMDKGEALGKTREHDKPVEAAGSSSSTQASDLADTPSARSSASNLAVVTLQVPSVEEPGLVVQLKCAAGSELLQKQASDGEWSPDQDKLLDKDQQQQQKHHQQHQQQKVASDVINASDHEETPQPEQKKIVRKTAAKPVAKKAVPKKDFCKEADAVAGCPSSKKKEDFERELNLLRSQQKPQKKTKEPKPKKRDPITDV